MCSGDIDGVGYTGMRVRKQSMVAQVGQISSQSLELPLFNSSSPVSLVATHVFPGISYRR